MSESGEEKEAIELIGSAEEEIRARLDAARRRAKEIVSDAEKRASEMIRAKESELAALEAGKRFAGRKPAGMEKEIEIPIPPKEALDELARELFTRLTGVEPKRRP